MRFFKHLAAAAFVGLGSVASAATITDNDDTIELGNVIEAFNSALFVVIPGPFGVTTSISGTNPGLPVSSNFSAVQTGMGPFTLSYTDTDLSVPVDIIGASTQIFQDATRFEALFTTGPSEQVLLEFLFASPISGSATLFEVNTVNTNVIPLPAGLPLLLAGIGGFAWLRRKQSA